MSTVRLRRATIQPSEIHAGIDGDVLTLHVPGFSWQGTIAEFHLLVEAGWDAVYRAVAHQLVLDGMLPKVAS